MSDCLALLGCHLLSYLLTKYLRVVASISELALLTIKRDRSDHLNAVRVDRSVNFHLFHVYVLHVFSNFA